MKLTNIPVILFILFVAVILRFYDFFEIPFTYDEFSALFRLEFDSFRELIAKGVKIDGHPAGIHVFLYYWTKLWGIHEWIIKLPFTLAGVGSVYLVWLIGKKWFNETVGLISSAYMASIEFTVMYSHIARPYISGMFFSLLMIHFWSNLMLNPQKNFIRNCLLFVLSASLCAYNHHFSLLFAAIVSVSGIFFIQRKFRIKYLVCGLLIFILYIPHLKIFFYQLNVGGIEGWLGKPRNDFFFEFIYYIFNYSVIVLSLTLAILLFGLFHLTKNKSAGKFIAISFAWFMLPFLIGFFYSKYVNAVLQFSVLIFSFPLLFFILFGFIKDQKPVINLVMVTLILLTNTLTLIYGRKYYDLFYNSVYQSILTDYDRCKKDFPKGVFIIESNKKISDYYAKKLNIDTNYVDYSKTFQNILEFKNYLETKSKTSDRLFLGCLFSIQPNVIPLIQDYFPTVEIQNNYYSGNTYVFSKGKRTENIIGYFDFDSVKPEKWSSVDTARIISSGELPGNRCYLMNKDTEWGPSFKVPLKDEISGKNNFIDISAEAKTNESFDGIILVSRLDSKGQNIHWAGTRFSEMAVTDSSTGEWQRIHHSIKLSDIDLRHEDILLTIFVWNKDKREFKLDNLKISLRDGNPFLYGLYKKL